MAFERDHFLAQQRKRAALEAAQRIEREQSMHDIRPVARRTDQPATIDQPSQGRRSTLLLIFGTCSFFLILSGLLLWKRAASSVELPIVSIDFSEKFFRPSSSALYIDESKTSSKFSSFKALNSGETTALIAAGPIKFVYRPPADISQKTLKVTAAIEGPFNWDVSLVCDTCSADNKYDWHPIYLDWLRNYSRVAHHDGLYVYRPGDPSAADTDTDVPDWLAKNVPPDKSLTIIDDAIPKSLFANFNVSADSSTSTRIDYVLRGPHTLYVNLAADLQLSFDKRDLNAYVGGDAIRAELRDLDGNMISEQDVPDDGDDEADSAYIPARNFAFTLNIPKSGTYELRFINADDKPSVRDWTLSHLQLNTNRIVFAPNTPIFFLKPAKLYTEASASSSLKAQIWYDAQIQEITLNTGSSTERLNLTKLDEGAIATKNLRRGPYDISYPGNAILTLDDEAALSASSFFRVFTHPIKTTRGDYVVTSIDRISAKNGTPSFALSFSSSTLARLRDLRNVNLQFRSTALSSAASRIGALSEENFHALGIYGGKYAVFAKNLDPQSVASSSATSTKDFLSSFPDNSIIQDDTADGVFGEYESALSVSPGTTTAAIIDIFDTDLLLPAIFHRVTVETAN
jgi:hypothetical protein